MKTFLFRSMVGIFFGGFLAVLFTNSVVLFGTSETLDGALFLKNSIGSILCGWIGTVSPLYFENEKLTLPKQTALHFATIFILYFVLAFVIGWIPFAWSSFFLMVLIFLVCYTIIWTCFYLYFRRQANKLNKELAEL